MGDVLLQVRALKKQFPVSGGLLRKKGEGVRAVDGVDLTISQGETLGLVGESGCGKSTLGRCILRLIEPTQGTVLLKEEDITACGKKQMRAMRQRMQIIFQDPYASLSPRMTIFETVKAPLDVFGIGSREERREKVVSMLRRVGLKEHQLNKYPNEFSGGQRQRVGIARALILNPELVVCDEPVSALDVSVRSQVLNLMQDLQAEFGLTYLFISHDLSVVKHISDHVAVMYLGNIVEISHRDSIYQNPLHPYTQALLSAIPLPEPGMQRDRILLGGDPPSPYRPPAGCKFHTRCPHAKEICATEIPVLEEKEFGHQVACHLYPRLQNRGVYHYEPAACLVR